MTVRGKHVSFIMRIAAIARIQLVISNHDQSMARLLYGPRQPDASCLEAGTQTWARDSSRWPAPHPAAPEGGRSRRLKQAASFAYPIGAAASGSRRRRPSPASTVPAPASVISDIARCANSRSGADSASGACRAGITTVSPGSAPAPARRRVGRGRRRTASTVSRRPRSGVPGVRRLA